VQAALTGNWLLLENVDKLCYSGDVLNADERYDAVISSVEKVRSMSENFIAFTNLDRITFCLGFM